LSRGSSTPRARASYAASSTTREAMPPDLRALGLVSECCGGAPLPSTTDHSAVATPPSPAAPRGHHRSDIMRPSPGQGGTAPRPWPATPVGRACICTPPLTLSSLNERLQPAVSIAATLCGRRPAKAGQHRGHRTATHIGRACIRPRPLFCRLRMSMRLSGPVAGLNSRAAGLVTPHRAALASDPGRPAGCQRHAFISPADDAP
jgi:hypothetical protein